MTITKSPHVPFLRILWKNIDPDARIRVGDEYRLQRSGTRYLDTMSLHIATAGMTSSQRLVRLYTVHLYCA